MIAIITITLVPVSSQSPDEQYMAGCANFLKGDYAKAVESFSLAIMHNNADEQLYIKRGISLLNLKETDRAVVDFNEANLIVPGVADLWLARTYALAEDKDKALLFLKSHLNSAFRLNEDSIKKDPAFDKLQGTPEWYSIWQQEWYSSEEKVAAEANYYAKKKHFDTAVSLLDGKIASATANPNLFLLRGRIYYTMANYAASIADFSAALNLDKHVESGYSLRGIAYSKAGRFKDAINDFNKALKDDPGNFMLYVQRAEAYAGLQSWESAIKDMTFYLHFFDDDLQVLYQCGEYYFSSDDYINALKCFNLNLKEDPNNSLYFKARGKTYVKTAMYRYAISDLAMSLDLQPGDAETWMYLGIAKIQSGDKDNGCSDLEKARQMGSTEVLKYIVEYCR